MQILGFNLTKISASRIPEIVNNPIINTNIEFFNIEKEEMEFLKGDQSIKFSFKFSVDYLKPEDKDKKNPIFDGKIEFEGIIILSAEEKEVKDILKNWKKKQVVESVRIPLFNFILRKCSSKALDLEDQIGLNLHLPFPQIRPQPKQE